MNKRLLIVASFFLLPCLSSADDKASATDVQDSLAPPSCKMPTLPSSVRLADDTSEFDEKVDAYKDCITTYVSDQNVLAKKHTDAANNAVNEFNDFTKKVNEFRASRSH